jgi:hypothetical protein
LWAQILYLLVEVGANARVSERNFTEGSVFTARRPVELQPLTKRKKKHSILN